MDFLLEFLLELLAGGGPDSDRGLVGTVAFGSLGLSVAMLWLVIGSAETAGPIWRVVVPCGCLLCGAAGLLLSGLHLSRTDDRWFSIMCLLPNLAGVAIPAAWFFLQ
jgi:hypothetical protein